MFDYSTKINILVDLQREDTKLENRIKPEHKNHLQKSQKKNIQKWQRSEKNWEIIDWRSRIRET